MSTQTANSTDEVPHPQYHSTKRKSYGSQQAVAEAWADGAFPTHNVDSSGDAVLYSGSPRDSRFGDDVDGPNTNFHGVQHADGTGTLYHYSTREAIRTRNGHLISNQQCWATGFAHCSTPADCAASVPLSVVERFLDTDDDVYDIVHVHSDDEFGENGRIAHVAGEEGPYGIAFDSDASAARGSMPFAFRVTNEEIVQALENGVTETIETLLKPADVVDSELPVVDSSEYTKTRLNDAELDAHKAAGGSTVEVESYRGTTEQNRQHYRADLRGEAIVRQGEWFFIPEPEAEPSETGCLDAESILDSHRAQRQGGARMPLPTECPECDSSSFEVPNNGAFECSNGHEIPRDIYVRGEIRHTDGDHNAMNLGETWHRAVTHDRDVRTYSRNPSGGSSGRRGRMD